MFFVEYLHDCEILLLLFLFFLVFYAFEGMSDKKQWLALKSCNVENPVSNSSLTYKHQKHWKTCGYFEESSIQPEQMNNFREMSEMSTLWFGKTSRERRKDGKDYMNPEDGASEASTLTLSPCK
jgi:hypothetical protein